MVLEIRDVHDKKTAEEYMVLKAIELGGTLNVRQSDFNEGDYQRAKMFYEDSKIILTRDYDIDTRAFDKVIHELEGLVHQQGPLGVKQ